MRCVIFLKIKIITIISVEIILRESGSFVRMTSGYLLFYLFDYVLTTDKDIYYRQRV